jgi:hypothetical protein
MKRDTNWQKYLSLDQRKYAGQVVVIAAGKLIGSGKGRKIQTLLALARKQYPGETPLIGQIRDPKKLYVY